MRIGDPRGPQPLNEPGETPETQVDAPAKGAATGPATPVRGGPAPARLDVMGHVTQARRRRREQEEADPDQPRLPKESVGAKYADWKGDLYVDGIEPRDVIQNDIGDCFFLASVAAIANTDPDILKDMIQDNGDGTYIVTFHKKIRDEVLDVPVMVKPSLPEKDGELIGAQTTRDGVKSPELWTAILEKAFAVSQGGYHVINEGGQSEEALRFLTGAKVEHRVMEDMKDGEIWQKITRAVKDGHPVTTSTPDTKDGEDEFDPKTGIVSSHQYTMLDAYERDGEWYVKLRNPWGEKEPEGDEVDDGVFELSFKKWRKEFEDFDIAKV